MTEVSTPHDKYEQHKRMEREQTIAAVLAAPMEAKDSTFSVEWGLTTPLRLKTTHPPLVITRVRVSTTRSLRPRPGSAGDDGPYVTAKGYGRSLNAKDEPDKREMDTWRPLPSELAETLLGRALVQ